MTTVSRRLTIRTDEPSATRQVTVEKQRRTTVAQTVRYASGAPAFPVLTSAPIEVTRDDSTFELELTQLGSFPLATLAITTLGNNFFVTDTLTGGELVSGRVFSQFADNAGTPFPDIGTAIAYIATANAAPTIPDFSAEFVTALTT